MSTLLYAIILLCLLAGRSWGAIYSQTNSIAGSNFFQSFSFQAISDPSHGRVNYVNAATAASQNLTYASGNHFVVRADFKRVLNPSGPGRNSVRLISNDQFTTSVTIFNVRHMPQGCGTWPSLWTNGLNWPAGGEIDILEGINDQGPNTATLHTSPGCTMPSSRSQTGSPITNNCNTQVNNNKGCSVGFNDPRSFGPSFNSNGGGWFAMERTTSYVKVWFWSRSSTNVPSDVRNGAMSVNTKLWGTPAAYFPNTSCPIGNKFGPHNIMIDLTFCGDWAGNDYSSSGCPSTCVDYVNNNPYAFTDAYFDFAWLNIYE